MTVRPAHEISAIIAGAECPLSSQSLYDGYRRELRHDLDEVGLVGEDFVYVLVGSAASSRSRRAILECRIRRFEVTKFAE